MEPDFPDRSRRPHSAPARSFGEIRHTVEIFAPDPDSLSAAIAFYESVSRATMDLTDKMNRAIELFRRFDAEAVHSYR